MNFRYFEGKFDKNSKDFFKEINAAIQTVQNKNLLFEF